MSAVAMPEGTVRAGPLSVVVETLSGFGADIGPVLGAAGMSEDSFSNPERAIAVSDAARLLELCAARTGCAYFGLLAGQKVGPSHLGNVGSVLGNAPTVGAALQGLVLSLHLNGHAGVPVLCVREETAELSFTFYSYIATGSRHVADFAVAVGFNLMRALCGPGWSPLAMLLAHTAPSERHAYAQVFGVAVDFDTERNAIVFPARWLLHRPERTTSQPANEAVDPEISQRALDLVVRSRRAVIAAIVEGDASVEHVAALIGMSRRSLNRRLAAERTSIRELIQDVRFRVARQLLADTRLCLEDVAATLGYAESSTFTRAFHGWAGVPPSAWRAHYHDAEQELVSFGRRLASG